MTHFYLDFDHQIFDILQFSALVSPKTIVRNMGVVWTGDDAWLLTFRDTTNDPFPPEFLSKYAATLNEPGSVHGDWRGMYERMRMIYREQGENYPLHICENLPPLKGWQ